MSTLRVLSSHRRSRTNSRANKLVNNDPNSYTVIKDQPTSMEKTRYFTMHVWKYAQIHGTCTDRVLKIHKSFMGHISVLDKKFISNK